jgi:hypothetical protein
MNLGQGAAECHWTFWIKAAATDPPKDRIGIELSLEHETQEPALGTNPAVYLPQQKAIVP